MVNQQHYHRGRGVLRRETLVLTNYFLDNLASGEMVVDILLRGDGDAVASGGMEVPAFQRCDYFRIHGGR